MCKVILSYADCGKKSHLLCMVNSSNSPDYTNDTGAVCKKKINICFTYETYRKLYVWALN